MDAAWEQVGKVLDAQRRIRFGQFSLQASQIWYDRHLMPMLGVSQQKTLLLMAPLNKRVLSDGVTRPHHRRELHAAGDDFRCAEARDPAARSVDSVAAVRCGSEAGSAPRASE